MVVAVIGSLPTCSVSVCFWLLGQPWCAQALGARVCCRFSTIAPEPVLLRGKARAAKLSLRNELARNAASRQNGPGPSGGAAWVAREILPCVAGGLERGMPFPVSSA